MSPIFFTISFFLEPYKKFPSRIFIKFPHLAKNNFKKGNMEFKSSEISLKEFLLLQPKQNGEFITNQAFSFDNTSLHTNDTLSHSEETWSLASLSVKKPSKLKMKTVVDPNTVTLKEMVIKRQRTHIPEKADKTMQKSKKIKKDIEDKTVTSASFAKRQHTQKWNIEETKKFYKVKKKKR